MESSFEFYMDFDSYSGFQAFMITFTVMSVIFFAVAAVMYILKAIAIKKLASTLKHPDPWLSFLPGAQTYLLGYTADARAVINDRKRTKYRIILPVLTSIITLGYAFFFAFFIYLTFCLGMASEYGHFDKDSVAAVFMIVFFICMCILSVLSIVLEVYNYITLYNIYKVFRPNYATVFLVLSILLNISSSIILFCIKNETPKQDEVVFVPQTLPPQYQQGGYNQYNGQNCQQSPAPNYQQPVCSPVENNQQSVQNSESSSQSVQPSDVNNNIDE